MKSLKQFGFALLIAVLCGCGTTGAWDASHSQFEIEVETSWVEARHERQVRRQLPKVLSCLRGFDGAWCRRLRDADMTRFYSAEQIDQIFGRGEIRLIRPTPSDPDRTIDVLPNSAPGATAQGIIIFERRFGHFRATDVTVIL